MQELKLWEFIVEEFTEDNPVALLCVLESKGSSPGRQGFKMAVTLHNRMIGSIGGGIMEHKLVEFAREMLNTERTYPIIKEQFHNKESGQNNRSGMICSGEQTVFMYYIQEEDTIQIKRVLKSLERKENGKLIITESGVEFKEELPEEDFLFTKISGSQFVYSEKTGYKNQLSIIGGGHCAQALSSLMNAMDFQIFMYENRKTLEAFNQNNFANKVILNDYSDLKEIKFNGKNHYFSIMTFAYSSDYIALKALLDRKFKYLGVLGSKSKIKEMFNNLVQEGFSEDKLKTIHAPIGIDIKSQTPEEIAISIAAEIIKVKNADYK